MNRRKFLKYTGSISIFGLTGCSSLRQAIDKPRAVGTRNVDLSGKGIRNMSFDLTEYKGRFVYEFEVNQGTGKVFVRAPNDELIDKFSISSGTVMEGSFNVGRERIEFRVFAGEQGLRGVLNVKLY